MKKAKIICTLALALVALAACNLFEQVIPNQPDPNPTESTVRVTLNLTVAPVDAFGTKGTTKQGWEDGDYVYLFFAPTGTASYSGLKNVIAKYDEVTSQWVVEANTQEALNDITTGGQVLAIYTFGGKRTIVDDSLKGLFHLGDASDDPTKAYGLTFSQVGEYTFTSGSPAEVNVNLTLERVGVTQITVTGITNDENNQWVLYNCGIGAEVFSGVGQLSAKFEGGDFVASALLTSMDEVPSINSGSDAVTFYVAGIDSKDKSVRLILHNTKTHKNYVRILDAANKVEDNKAYTIVGPEPGTKAGATVATDWHQGFLIEYTADSEPEFAGILAATPEEFVASDHDAMAKRGYVIFKSGCPYYAFLTDEDEQKGYPITTVAIQKGITTIGKEAFNNCDKLTTIDLPSTLNSIGSNAFQGTSLETIDLSGTSLTEIGEGAFKECNILETITLPSALTTIGKEAFNNCKKLTTIDLPSTLNSIGSNAFQGTSLETIDLSGTRLTTINGGAFADCSRLGVITLPNTLTKIDGYAFSGCSALRSITLPGGVNSVGSYAFSGCSALGSITLPGGVNTVGDHAFAQCDALESITLQEGVITIGNCAFELCSTLKNITLPSSLTTIGEKAFNNCPELESIILPEGVTTIAKQAFQICQALKDITLPSTLSTIGEDAFYWCSALESITLPAGVTTIDKNAFSDCEKLQTVISLNPTPPSMGSGVFGGTSSSLSIYVPDDSIGDYKAAANWVNYTDKIHPISEKP